MKHLALKLPHKVFTYMVEHYPNHSLVCARDGKDNKGQLFYVIDFLHGDKYHHLKITGAGALIHEDMEPQFMNDHHEQYF